MEAGLAFKYKDSEEGVSQLWLVQKLQELCTVREYLNGQQGGQGQANCQLGMNQWYSQRILKKTSYQKNKHSH